jgi:tetratricopeptide (TPR) repeat protein
MTSPGLAQPPSSAQDDVATDRAGLLYDEGLALYEAERYAESYAVYIAAWSLKKHYQIAGNLGDCELRLGKYRDAAEHLTYYLREYPKDKPAENAQRAQALLDEAKRHIGTLDIVVDARGADVFLDGKVLGQTPLTEPVFVEPGKHSIEIRRGQVSTLRTLDVNAGSEQTVRLNLTTPGHPAPPAPQVDWKAAVSGALGAIGIGAGIGLLAKASAVDAEAAQFRRDNNLVLGTECHDNPSAACQKLGDLAKRQIPYSAVGIGAIALGAGGIGLTTYYFVRAGGTAKGPRVGVGVLPGPGIQLRGSF